MRKSGEKMEKEIFDNYVKAGHIASQVRDEFREKIKPEISLLEIANAVESRIRELGGEPAFPVNISVNNVAAHYTPPAGDETAFKQGDMVKLDIGVHVNGYIGDTATTIYLGDDEKESQLVLASKKALEEALKIVKPGTKISEIGEAVEKAITEMGFKPISNLTGHGLDQYDLHAEPQIPNVKITSGYELKEDQIIAIEPFASSGDGYVRESGETLIYMILYPHPVRNPEARQIIKRMAVRQGLPFAKRWLQISDIKLRLALRELKMRNAIHEYPILKDRDDCKISQHEHTIIVMEKPVVTTRVEE